MSGPIPAWPKQRRRFHVTSWRRLIMAAIAVLWALGYIVHQFEPPQPGTVDFCDQAFDRQLEQHSVTIPESCTGAFGG